MSNDQRAGGPSVGAANGSVLTAAGQDWLAGAYRDHGAAVHAVACGLCGPALAYEVTRVVFIRLGHGAGGLDRGSGTLRASLVAMARSKAIAVESEMGREDSVAAASRGGDAARVFAALRRLPEPERSALVVAFYGRCTCEETARILQQPEGTTKAQIRSGLRHLTVALAESSR